MIIGELYKVTAFDGLEFTLNDAFGRFVVSTPGEMGMPPISFLTRRSYKQDGESVTGYRLDPRPFALSIRLVNSCSREEYWRLRSAFLNAVRPNRGGLFTLTLALNDGTLRAIKAFAISPTFPEIPSEEWDEWGLSEILQLQCFDPAWFNPTEAEQTLVVGSGTELTFPITFDDNNIYFDSEGLLGTLAISYTGTWYSYPIIEIDAPLSGFEIHHAEIDKTIQWIGQLLTGTLTIDLVNRTITDSSGNDLWGYLTAVSDIQAFRIEPDPIAGGGVNTLQFNVPDFDPNTGSVRVRYNTRYIGI